MWKVVQCAVQGRGHIKESIPCQDKAHYFIDEGVIITALADGAGSAKLSHIGADGITRYICEDLAENFDLYYENEDGVAVKTLLDDKIKSSIEELAKKAECDPKDLASTLLVAAVKSGHYILIHIGDGVIGYSKNGVMKVASQPENGEFVNTTIFTTSSEALLTMRLMKGALGSIDSFILMSDGTEASLYNKREKSLAGALSKIVKLMSYLPTEKIRDQLENSFQSVIRHATTDDCSISIMANCSDEFDGFNSLTSKEKSEILQVKLSDPNGFKRLKRYDKILGALQSPQTLKQISSILHLKPKYTKKHINKLMELNLIEKFENQYRTLIVM